MKFDVQLTESAKDDLTYFSAREQRIIIDGLRRYLQDDAGAESKKRKKLKTNEIAAWELRLGKRRVFYDIEEEGRVKIMAIGFKEHNELFIKGGKVEL
jgi:mRNA-degrading endonuclease RelE of RelBE toxin-antitoxin system